MTRKKPGQRLAYLPYAEPETLAECLVAFANGDGGLIVLGLNSNGRPTDPIWEEEGEGALREAASFCRPPVPTQWQPVTIGAETYVGIYVPRSTELHSLDNGRVLIRSGAQNRPLSGDEIRQLAASKNVAEYETEAVPGARPDDLDQDIIRDYLDRRERRGAAKDTSTSELLFAIGAADRDGNPTTNGILLFGKNPQTFFPQSGIVLDRKSVV